MRKGISRSKKHCNQGFAAMAAIAAIAVLGVGLSSLINLRTQAMAKSIMNTINSEEGFYAGEIAALHLYHKPSKPASGAPPTIVTLTNKMDWYLSPLPPNPSACEITFAIGEPIPLDKTRCDDSVTMIRRYTPTNLFISYSDIANVKRYCGRISLPGDKRTRGLCISEVTPLVAPTIDISANNSFTPISIASGDSATIRWSSTNATSCSVSPGGWTGTNESTGKSTGAITVFPAVYTVSCTGPGGSVSDSIAINLAPFPCTGGEMVGGFCWYLASAGQSCTSKCSAKGGVYDSATRDYAGSNGSNAHCEAVMDALMGSVGIMYPPITPPPDGVGCVTTNNAAREVWRYTNTTTANAGFFVYYRACACK